MVLYTEGESQNAERLAYYGKNEAKVAMLFKYIFLDGKTTIQLFRGSSDAIRDLFEQAESLDQKVLFYSSLSLSDDHVEKYLHISQSLEAEVAGTISVGGHIYRYICKECVHW